MIVIINTGIGNFKSIQNMLSRLGEKSILSNQITDIQNASKLILPGVGAFDKGMQALQDHNLVEVICDKVERQATKFLGICLGMQLLAESSEEGVLPGLGIIKGHVQKFDFLQNTKNLKIPHMGWNYVIPLKDSCLFQKYEGYPKFYFTHSYRFQCHDKSDIIANTPYGDDFTSAIQRGNIYGVQFHPEKSHRFGLQLLKNFLSC